MTLAEAQEAEVIGAVLALIGENRLFEAEAKLVASLAYSSYSAVPGYQTVGSSRLGRRAGK